MQIGWCTSSQRWKMDVLGYSTDGGFGSYDLVMLDDSAFPLMMRSCGLVTIIKERRKSRLY